MKSNILINFFKRSIAPIKRQIRTMVVRGIIKIVEEDKKIQKVQIDTYEDETREDVERFNDFGFKSYPPVGTEAIMLSISGNNEHMAVIATENREILKELPDLEEGDCIIYTKEKKYLHFKEKNIEISLEKIKIENDDNELISVISDFIDQVRKSKWNTAIGPQPIFEADGILLDDIKSKIDSFKI